MRGRRTLAVAAALPVAMLLAACGASSGSDDGGPGADPDQVDSVEAPELGACRTLSLADVGEASNAGRTVDCAEKHTAQTYAVGNLPGELDDAGYDSTDVAQFAYQTCTTKLAKFLGADESTSLRTLLTWAWFRPSEQAWDDGARWYRCDVVGGSEATGSLSPLPETAEGLLQGRPDDRWMTCVDGPSVNGAPRVACSADHEWRAVTTIKLGEPDDPYPGDRVSEVTTRDYCSDSVGAWLNYPVDYDYAYTWFHEAEWDAGNRRSVCWAKTTS